MIHITIDFKRNPNESEPRTAYLALLHLAERIRHQDVNIHGKLVPFKIQKEFHNATATAVWEGAE